MKSQSKQCKIMLQNFPNIQTSAVYEILNHVIELEKQRDALIVENIAVKSAHNSVVSDFDNTMRQITRNSTVRAAYPLPKTPVTDQAVANTGEGK